jgi:ubiquinone/menaquinone biosynthesis C-methylase UbiE
VTTGAGETGYLLDNKNSSAGQRFQALSSLFDRSTFRHLRDLGIAPGWRCWEVGAGGPTVVTWMARQAGPGGRVLATDIDLSWAAEGGGGPTVELRRHDVAADPPPAESFDLVHARLLMVHLPQRDQVLRQLVSVLRPGGWLLLEDADTGLQPLTCLEARTPDEQLANRLRASFRQLLIQRGADLQYGRTLPRRLREAGLLEVAADAYFPVALPACVELELATITMLRGQLLAHGTATEEDLDRHVANVAAGRLDLAQPPMISAWGRKA